MPVMKYHMLFWSGCLDMPLSQTQTNYEERHERWQYKRKKNGQMQNITTHSSSLFHLMLSLLFDLLLPDICYFLIVS